MRTMGMSLIAAIAVTLVPAGAWATTVTWVPYDPDMGDLDHSYVYGWGIAEDLTSSGEELVSATLTISRIANWDANENDLYIPASILNPYYEVKWAMEMEAIRAAAQGLQVIVVLPTAVFGPGDIKPTTGSFLLAMAQGRIPGYVESAINVVDGRDVATGHIAAAKRGKLGQRYILGGHNLSVQEMLTIAADAAGRRPPGLKLPLWLVRVAAGAAERLGVAGTHHLRAIDHWQMLDDSRTRTDLGLPDPIPFAQTCRDTLDWFYENGYLKSQPTPRPAAESAGPSGNQ